MAGETTVATDTLDETAENGAWDQHRVAQSIVNRHSVLAGGAGAVPLPVADSAALLGVELNMIKRLCDTYDVKFSARVGKNVIASLLATALPFTLASTGMSILKAFPLIGSWAGVLTMPSLNAGFTYAAGQVLIKDFESGGDLINFDAKKSREYFHQKLKEGAPATA